MSEPYGTKEALHYLGAIKVRLELLYMHSMQNARLLEHLSDEVDWVDAEIERLRSPNEAATTPEPLTDAIAEYARDIRRNASGADDYPWEVMRAVADSLEEILNYSGGAESPLHDEYVMDRAKAAMASLSVGAAQPVKA